MGQVLHNFIITFCEQTKQNKRMSYDLTQRQSRTQYHKILYNHSIKLIQPMNVLKTFSRVRTNEPYYASEQQLTQQQRAAKTLIDFSQESSREQDHFISSHYHRRFVLKQNVWGEDFLSKQPICWPNKKKQFSTRHKRNKTHAQRYQSPSNLCLELTKSLEAIEPSREYRVTVKPRCFLSSSTHLQAKEQKMFRRKPDRQKIRFSNHIIPTPRAEETSVEIIASRKKEGGAIKKIKQDIIRSLECKMEEEQSKWDSAIKQVVKDRTQISRKQKTQTGSFSLYRTGKFRESIKLKIKKGQKYQIEAADVKSNSLRPRNQLQGQKREKPSINKSEEFQMLESLLFLEKFQNIQ